MTSALPPHAQLRSATAADHAKVDAAYSCFVLDDPQSYGRFLLAHARCLAPIEAELTRVGQGSWTPRLPMLHDDLRALGLAPPDARAALPLENHAAAWGACYVIEGSRLGGAVLRRKVPAGLPVRYLSAAHPAGRWRVFLGELDDALVNDADVAQAIVAARAVFALFAASAKPEPCAADA